MAVLIGSNWVSGALRFFVKATAQGLLYLDPSVPEVTVPSGSVLNIKSGAFIQNNGVNMDLSSGIATSTTSSTAELNTLTGVTGGMAAASKAVVLDANLGVTGLRKVGLMRVTAAAAGDAAITIAPKDVFITKGSAAALTLADPGATDEGTEITFIATTAFAHTVDNSAGSGFNAGGATKDVATFGGAIGDRLTVVAYNTKWYVKDSLNITLG